MYTHTWAFHCLATRTSLRQGESICTTYAEPCCSFCIDTAYLRTGGKEELTKKSEATAKAQDMACERTTTKHTEVTSHEIKAKAEE